MEDLGSRIFVLLMPKQLKSATLIQRLILRVKYYYSQKIPYQINGKGLIWYINLYRVKREV